MMNKKFTDWLPAQLPPAHRGPYQVRNSANPRAYTPKSTRYWTGKRWLLAKNGPPSNFGQGLVTGVHDEWRGLLKPPGAGKTA